MKIPELEPHQAVMLLQKVTPLLNEDGVLSTFDLPDLWNMSFLWNPEGVKPLGRPLRKVGEIQTLHTFGYVGLFKPSIAEVLAQLPKDLTGIVGFSVQGPQTASDIDDEMANAGFHVATTTLWGEVES